MLSSTPENNAPKFLLDENINKELLISLKSEGFDAIFKSKGLTNGELAKFSLSEKRILVTNDKHFANPSLFSKDKIFSVILLKLTQYNPFLIKSFSNFIDKTDNKDFEGKIFTLFEDRIEFSELE